MSADRPAPAAPAAGALAGMRVVEWSEGVAGAYAAKLLGDFGAEVVKVETPEGDPARRRGPFPDARPDPEASGLFLYLNVNKRGIVLDADHAHDRARLDGLLARADVFVTDSPADRLDAAGVAPAALRTRHPRLVATTLSPFGSEGPWAGRRGDDIVTWAASGFAYASPGIPDAAADLDREPPLHPACFVAETIAGLVAATATLAAFHGRAATNEGCHVEVSQQAAVAAMLHRDVTAYSYSGLAYDRLLNPAVIGRMPNFYLPCRDGYVALAAPLELHWERLVEAMGNPAWARAPGFATAAARVVNWAELRLKLIEWTMTLTGDELYALASRQQIPTFPFWPVRRMVASEQVRERGSLVGIEAGGRPARMPGAPFAMQGTPWALRRPAPRLGEHTDEILREWLGATA